MKTTFDYIIAGSGMAGLSLLYRLLQTEEFSSSHILLLDREKKNQNDRTWCFWEKEAGIFEDLVCHRWESLQFFSPSVSSTFKLEEYSYKMIRSGDFYEHILEIAHAHPNVVIHQAAIDKIEDNAQMAQVVCGDTTFEAPYVFNSSSLFYPKMDESNTLLQHFMGWFIRTKSDYFDPKVGRLMDFRLEQKEGATFMYVLPTDTKEALIEYTLFSPRILDKDVYKKELRDYIDKELQIKEYEIVHDEFGVIPMSAASFPRSIGHHQRIINIGTAGGFTKASSGYTFHFVQKHLAKMILQMKEGKSPLIKPSLEDRKFDWYDFTLLDVLLKEKLTGEQIFTALFKKNPPEKILGFLANESSAWDEFKIRNAVPTLPFMTSGIKGLFRK
ncbi:MAG: lycopene cyclase [Cyclobacteriaceae bacterium]|nr:lycopene cyclase [Cyclobacteriaceae bacterium]MCH8517103.1 lycopene cyclase [Cyclobacteriaceae bacterium]